MSESGGDHLSSGTPDKEPPVPEERRQAWPAFLVAGLAAASAAIAADGGAIAEVLKAPAGEYFTTAESLGAAAVYGTWRHVRK
jgi:hypothetical protein